MMDFNMSGDSDGQYKWFSWFPGLCVCVNRIWGRIQCFAGPWGIQAVSNKWLWNKAGGSVSSWGVLSLEMIFNLPSVHWRSQDGIKNVFLIIKGTKGGKYLWGKWDHTGEPWSVDLILHRCCVLCICGGFTGLMKWAQCLFVFLLLHILLRRCKHKNRQVCKFC